MDLNDAAACLEALGSPHRLEIFKLLVESGPAGLPVGKIQTALGLPASTLSHHLSRLVGRGLVHQTRESRNLICCCDYERMDAVLGYLTENCCCGATDCDDATGGARETAT